MKHTISILEYFEYFCQMTLKSINVILSYTVSKFVRFLRHSVLYWTTEPQCQLSSAVMILFPKYRYLSATAYRKSGSLHPKVIIRISVGDDGSEKNLMHAQ